MNKRATWIVVGLLFVILFVLWLIFQAVGAVLSFIFSFKGLIIILILFLAYQYIKRRR